MTKESSLQASKSMLVYETFISAIDMIDCTAEEKLEYYEAIFKYGMNGEMPRFSNPSIAAIFIAIKPNIDTNTRKRKRFLKCVENGKKGGAPKKNQNARKQKVSAKKTTIDVDVDVDADVDVDEDIFFYGKKEKTLLERNHDFYNSLRDYVEQYGVDTIQSFYEYWKETTPDGKYMRFELEKTWNTSYRLELWVAKRQSLNL